MCKALAELGVIEPTEIQTAAIPKVLYVLKELPTARQGRTDINLTGARR